MTPDGISTQDWDRVHELAVAIANAVGTEEEAQQRRALLDFLGELRARYGELPSILATEADYVDDPATSERLLLRGLSLAQSRNASRNERYITLSVAALYARELQNVAAAEEWLAKARALLAPDDKSNSIEVDEIEKSLRQLRQAKG